MLTVETLQIPVLWKQTEQLTPVFSNFHIQPEKCIIDISVFVYGLWLQQKWKMVFKHIVHNLAKNTLKRRKSIEGTVVAPGVSFAYGVSETQARMVKG